MPEGKTVPGLGVAVTMRSNQTLDMFRNGANRTPEMTKCGV